MTDEGSTMDISENYINIQGLLGVASHRFGKYVWLSFVDCFGVALPSSQSPLCLSRQLTNTKYGTLLVRKR